MVGDRPGGALRARPGQYGHTLLLSRIVAPSGPSAWERSRERRGSEREEGPNDPRASDRCGVAAVPFGFSEGGLPLSVQVVGRLHDDVGVLRMAAAVEQTRPWGHRWPPLAEA